MFLIRLLTYLNEDTAPIECLTQYVYGLEKLPLRRDCQNTRFLLNRAKNSLGWQINLRREKIDGVTVSGYTLAEQHALLIERAEAEGILGRWKQNKPITPLNVAKAIH